VYRQYNYNAGGGVTVMPSPAYSMNLTGRITMKTYTYHCDPGHGWVAVPVSELKELAIDGKVTSCSYISADGQTAYLEEDCDMSLWIDAVVQSTGSQPEMVQEHTNDYSPIREYNCYNMGVGR